jgi:hypothetical protein
LAEEEREGEARRLAIEEAQLPFDLSRGPMLRASLLKLDAEDYVVLLTMHHIASDGWSIGILIREVATLYQAFSENQPSPLAELEIQYADYAAWQRTWITGEVLDRQLEYWKKQLAEAPSVLELPYDRPRPLSPTYKGESKSFRLPASLSKEIKLLSRKERVTVFMLLLAAFKTLLHRYSGQMDIVVGSAIANRNRAEVEGLVGFFVNMLVLRTQLSGQMSFRELLQRVREVSLGAYAHQDLPFDKLVEELHLHRQSGHAPFFQVAFGLQNIPTTPFKLPGLSLTNLPPEHEVVRYDLTLWISEDPEGLSGVWTYSTELFDAKTIDTMTRRFETLLHSIVANPETALDTLQILTDTEREQIAIAEKVREDSKYKMFRAVKPKPVAVLEKSEGNKVLSSSSKAVGSTSLDGLKQEKEL